MKTPTQISIKQYLTLILDTVTGTQITIKLEKRLLKTLLKHNFSLYCKLVNICRWFFVFVLELEVLFGEITFDLFSLAFSFSLLIFK